MKTFSTLGEINNMSRAAFEEACLANIHHVYVGNDTVLCKVLTKYKMYVDTKDMGIAPHLIMDGYWESWVTRLLTKIVQPGFVC
jgi:hypothetical protein